MWLALPFCVVNFLIGPIATLKNYFSYPLRGVWFALFASWMGVIASQATFWNLYFSLSSESLYRRISILTPLVILGGGAGLLGFAFAAWYEEWRVGDLEWWENGARFYCLLPIIMVTGQAPFFACRMFGWSLRPVNASSVPTADHSNQPMSIADLLLATAAVAGAFTAIRIAPTSTFTKPEEFWLMAAVFCCLASCCSLFGGVPLLVLLHYVRHPLLRFLWIVVVLLVGFVVACLILVYFSGWDELFNEALFNSLMFSGILLWFVAALYSHLYLLRRFGWAVAPRP
ncbi:hypothetical protein [Anatilimnocola floriformis]|uniref:hypothetical protein n=1 Tax=Anatilimnocola floriformis TaxID=2948575 RepID=UPI0020C58949|nr:hypothetical protein [Anatilimnocola floriformis]